MTIEAIYQVECDGCMNDCSIEEQFDTKAEVWEWLKSRGWKQRRMKGQMLHWCGRCVANGIWKEKYVAWAEQ